MSGKEVYPYFNEFSYGGAANCYTGSLCEVMRLEGIKIQEYVIYLLGNGFKLYTAIDEFGDAKLFTKLLETVNVFCEKYGVKLNYTDMNRTEITNQIFDILEKHHIIVWLNSKYLKYSDFYNSQDEGYLHAIVLKRKVNFNLVQIIDSLIVSAPTTNCTADFEIGYLEKALFSEIEKPELINVTGKIITLTRGKNVPIVIDDTLIRSNLYSSSIEILQDYGNEKESAIMKFYKQCQISLKQDDEKRKIWLLLRINKMIKTLWIIPNRKILFDIISKLNIAKYEEEIMLHNLEALINNWMVLANCCLKCAVLIHNIDTLEKYFIKVDKSEVLFWEYTKNTLKRYI